MNKREIYREARLIIRDYFHDWRNWDPYHGPSGSLADDIEEHSKLLGIDMDKLIEVTCPDWSKNHPHTKYAKARRDEPISEINNNEAKPMKLTKFALYELADYGDSESGPIPSKDWLGFYDSLTEAEQARDELQRDWKKHVAIISEDSNDPEGIAQGLDIVIEEELIDAAEYARFVEECAIHELESRQPRD